MVRSDRLLFCLFALFAVAFALRTGIVLSEGSIANFIPIGPLEAVFFQSPTDGTVVIACAVIWRSFATIVSEVRAHAEKLADAEQTLRQLIEGVSDYAICMLDPQGRVKTWNAGAEKITSYRRDEILGEPFARFFTAADAASGAPAAALAGAADSGRSETEGWRVRKDRSLFWASVILTPIRDAGGELVGFSTIIRDITDRHAAGIALDQAKDAAERANRAKSEFFAGISHELRTPMNAILGFGQMLQLHHFGPLNARQQEFVETILQSGNHLLNLLNDMLEFGTLEAGRLSVLPSRVELVPLMRSVVATLQPMADQHGIELLPGNFGEALPPLQADHTRLAQALINLGTNAIKYNRPHGSVTITCEKLDDNRVRISVSDTGIGIPQDRQAELFQPFNRLGAERTTIEGTGLGLSLSARVVELMGGRVGFISKQGEGSTFWVEVPAWTASAESETAALAEALVPMRMVG